MEVAGAREIALVPEIESVLTLPREGVEGLPTGQLRIHFPSQLIGPRSDYPRGLLNWIRGYAEWLPEHMTNHRVTPEPITEIVLVVYL